jgi:hypothetical protein
MTNISERINAASSRLDAIRAHQASAALDGEDFNPAELVNAEAEVAALQDALGEQNRRERLQQSQARQEARKDALSRIEADQKQLIETLQGIEENARALSSGIKVALELYKRISASSHEYSGKPSPTALSPFDTPKRLSNYLISVLSEATDNRHQIGNLRLPSSPAKPDVSWAREEARLLDDQLKYILEK